VHEHRVVPAHGRADTPDAHLGQPVGAESEHRHHRVLARPPPRLVPAAIKAVAAGWPGQRAQCGVRLRTGRGRSPVGGEQAAEPGAIGHEGDDDPARGHADRREHPVGEPEAGHQAGQAVPGRADGQQRVVVTDAHLDRLPRGQHRRTGGGPASGVRPPPSGSLVLLARSRTALSGLPGARSCPAAMRGRKVRCTGQQHRNGAHRRCWRAAVAARPWSRWTTAAAPGRPDHAGSGRQAGLNRIATCGPFQPGGHRARR
jgi:hypothetical protein